MAYCTAADLIERYGEDELIQLTDRADPPAGVVDQAVVDAAIADAGELIDGYLAGRYKLPLEEVPGILRRLACDITRALLHEERPTEAVKEARDGALKVLREIASGVIRLQIAGLEAPAAGGGRPRVSSAERVFTDATLKDFT